MNQRLLLSFCLLSLIHTLHTDPHKQSVTITSLETQKTQLESGIKAIGQTITSFKPAPTEEKNAFILSDPLRSQSQMMPLLFQTTLSTAACKQLTSQQTQSLNQQIHTCKSQLADITAGLLTLPQSTQTNAMYIDLNNQNAFLDGVTKAIASNCANSIQLANSVMQSNLLAEQWITGDQTIASIHQSYYKRTQLYKNINNCPLITPFFDGSKCIAVTAPHVFNIITQKVQTCPQDTDFDKSLHKCVSIPFVSNLAGLDNVLYNNKIPIPPPTSTQKLCPSTRPFYNGVNCVACSLPLYWNIAQRSCLACTSPLVYDVNIDTCVTAKPQLTNLDAEWVTIKSTVSTIVTERNDLIASSKTTLHTCPLTTPYFDGVTCISCPSQFNIDTNLCTTAATGNAYDPNLHTYLPLQTNVQTLPTSSNYITTTPLKDTTVPNCPAAAPHFDGVACITCPPIAPIFNADTKTCTHCLHTQLYNDKTHTCDNKPIVLVSTNVANLMATPAQSIADYNADITAAKANPNVIVQSCQNPSYYSDGTKCFPCKATEYFNVETLKCDTCTTTIDTKTSLCIHTVTQLTNLNTATNLVLPPTTTLATLKTAQAAIDGTTALCTAPLPYATSANTCIACSPPTIYFDLKSHTCVALPAGTTYNPTTMTFTPITKTTSNYAGATNYIQSGTSTAAADTAAAVATGAPIVYCPTTTPYYNGVSCVACTNAYFDIATHACVTQCPPNTQFQPTTKTCSQTVFITSSSATNYIATPTVTLASVTSTASLPPNTVVTVCSGSTPYSTGTACISCTTPTPYFDLTAKKCVACPANTVYQAATKSCGQSVFITSPTATNYIATPTVTLASVTNTASLPPNTVVTVCDSTTPYSTGTACISCPTTTPYFDLATKACVACPANTVYQAASKTCNQAVFITSSSATNYIATPTVTLASVTSTASLPPNTVVTVCSGSTPYSTGTACISCPTATPYFDLTAKKCVACPANTVYQAAIKSCGQQVFITSSSATNYIATPTVTLASVTSTASLPPNTVVTVCSGSTPYSTGTACISCTTPTPYFDLTAKKCVACPTNTVYNAALLKCTTPQLITNTNAANYIEVGTNTMVNEVSPTQFPANTLLSPCPLSTPFYTGTACIACSTPTPYFNLQTNLCTACPDGYTYSPHSCTLIPQNTYSKLQTTNWMTNSPTSTTTVKVNTNILANTAGTVECPTSHPFYNSVIRQCVSCPPNSFFNFDTNQCTTCTTPNTVNPLTHVCGPAPPTYYQTSLKSPNLIYNGQSTGEYADTYAANLATKPTTKDCPATTPYFNGVNCIACPPTTPYFNMYLLFCQNCAAPSTYSGNECLPSSGTNIVTTSPDIAKMYSTIF